MKADRPLDEVYADIKEILKAWVVWISHLSSYTSIFVHLHFFCPLMHAIETKKLDKAGKNYSAADFLQLSSKIYTNLFIPSNWHKITIRQFERAWVGNALYSVPWVLFELQQPTWNNKPGSAHRPLYFKIARQERELHIYAFILDQPGLFSICISILHLFNPCLGKLWESTSSQSSSTSPSSSQSTLPFHPLFGQSLRICPMPPHL